MLFSSLLPLPGLLIAVEIDIITGSGVGFTTGIIDDDTLSGRLSDAFISKEGELEQTKFPKQKVPEGQGPSQSLQVCAVVQVLLRMSSPVEQ